jgi:hypothetical protein
MGRCPATRFIPPPLGTTIGCCCQTQHGGRLTGALRKRPRSTFFLNTLLFRRHPPLLVTRTIQCITHRCSDIGFYSWVAAWTASACCVDTDRDIARPCTARAGPRPVCVKRLPERKIKVKGRNIRIAVCAKTTMHSSFSSCR